MKEHLIHIEIRCCLQPITLIFSHSQGADARLFSASGFVAAAAALSRFGSFGTRAAGRAASGRLHGFCRLVPAGPALTACSSACAAAFTFCHNITPSIFSFRRTLLYLTIISGGLSGPTANSLREGASGRLHNGYPSISMSMLIWAEYILRPSAIRRSVPHHRQHLLPYCGTG